MAEATFRPTVSELDKELGTLVEWERFGIHLRELNVSYIQEIKREKSLFNAAEKKIALYTKWLSVCDTASWVDVTKALKEAQEITLAAQVEKRLSNPTREMVAEKPPDIDMQFSWPPSSEAEIKKKLEDLHLTYTKNFNDVCEHLESLVQSGKLTYYRIASRIENAKLESVKGLTKCNSLSEIFDIIRVCNNFLDCSIFKMFIVLVIDGDSNYLKRTEDHESQVQNFKETQPIKALENQLKEFSIGKSQILVKIKLNNSWNKVQIDLVIQLIKHLLQYEGLSFYCLFQWAQYV